MQIICARLKILALPPGQAAVPPGAPAAVAGQQRAAGQPGLGRGALAPDILRGGWLPGQGQERLLPRLRWASYLRRQLRTGVQVGSAHMQFAWTMACTKQPRPRMMQHVKGFSGYLYKHELI